jgi:homoserine dehydrogenase
VTAVAVAEAPPARPHLRQAGVLDEAAGIIEEDPQLQILGADLVSRLRTLAAILRGESTHLRGL